MCGYQSLPLPVSLGDFLLWDWPMEFETQYSSLLPTSVVGWELSDSGVTRSLGSTWRSVCDGSVDTIPAPSICRAIDLNSYLTNHCSSRNIRHWWVRFAGLSVQSQIPFSFLGDGACWGRTVCQRVVADKNRRVALNDHATLDPSHLFCHGEKMISSLNIRLHVINTHSLICRIEKKESK